MLVCGVLNRMIPIDQLMLIWMKGGGGVRDIIRDIMLFYFGFHWQMVAKDLAVNHFCSFFKGTF